MRHWALAVALCLGLMPAAQADGPAMKARHAALVDALARSPFGQPLVLESTQSSGDLKGEIYAVAEHAFGTVEAALKRPSHWCEVLILHLNVKQCLASADTIALSLGKKHDEPLEDAYRIDLSYRLAARSADYLSVELHSESGPLGTRNYRIEFEAAPLDARRTFIRMSYAYSHGLAARLAMQGYLSTLGRGKVGFSIVEHKPDGQVVRVDSVRGVIERNTMRYYLAIDAYLSSLSAPADEQLEKRLRDWFAATERYPRQLHEVELVDYMAMKRKEVRRQQRATPTG